MCQKQKNLRKLIRRYLLGLLLIMPVQLLARDELPEANLQIRTAVSQFLQQRFPGDEYRFDIGHLDKRLRLNVCELPLQVFLPDGARQLGYTTVAVRCEGANLWKIHVPLSIKQFREVLVADRTLPRGSSLQARDVRLARRDLSRLNNGYFTNMNDVRELELKRTLRQGQILTASNLRIPRMIKRGESITIQAKSGQLSINVRGIAMMDGRKGEKIRVKNARSKQEVQAVVIGPGVVRITM